LTSRNICCWETETVATIYARDCVKIEKGEKPAWLSVAAPNKRAAAVSIAAMVFMVLPHLGGLKLCALQDRLGFVISKRKVIRTPIPRSDYDHRKGVTEFTRGELAAWLDRSLCDEKT
jgi:hypothetical protein